MKNIRIWSISVAFILLKEPHIYHHKFSVRILTENEHRISRLVLPFPNFKATIIIPISSELGS